MTYTLSQYEMDQYLMIAQAQMATAGYHGMKIDRCRHKTNSELSLWIFNPDGEQIGAIRLLDPDEDTYTASRMFRSLPTSCRTFDGLRRSILHVVEQH